MSEQALTRIEPMPGVMPEPTTPAALMRRATDVAGICREIVLKTACEIQGRKFVRVEGWESIATAHGCFAGAEDADRVYDNQGNHIGYKAKGVLRNAHGEIIATGEGCVGFDEKDRKGNPTWKNRAEYAGKAMAQTRAISRTCRGVFAHVVVLIDAGLSTTPAEEVPDGGFDDNARVARAKPANVPQSTPTATGTAKSPGSEPGDRASKPLVATEKTRAWFLAEMRKLFSDATLLQWAMDHTNPVYLMPQGETLEDWPLRHVPTSTLALQAMVKECSEFTGVKPGESPQTPAGASAPPNTTQGQASGASQTEYDGSSDVPDGDGDGLGTRDDHEPEPVEDGVETITGKLDFVKEKSGRSGKGPWTSYGLKVGDEWFNTFSKPLGECAKKDKGHTVRIQFRRGDRGNDLVSIERASKP